MVDKVKKKQIEKMVVGSSLVLRASIVLGMVAAVVTILYFTPIPDQNFKSCDRPCHTLDWPMICRIKLYVESLPLNIICQNCESNSTRCWHPYCESPTSSRAVLLANRQLPAPPIQVCHNDILVIDVINNVPGHSLTMHWRGQPNNEAPFMDGVPMVTQCPIPSYTTFQYKFRASKPGTHLYHAYSDNDRSRGLYGAFIVRQADKTEPHRTLYDVDSKEHFIVLSEWTKSDSSSTSILINGKGYLNGAEKEIFRVKKGKRHRFRVAYASSVTNCPITLSVDNHMLKVIAIDGNSIDVHEVTSLQLSKGERLDFILKANQEISTYTLRTRSSCNNKNLYGEALVSYKSIHGERVSLDNKLMKDGITFETSVCSKKPNKVCLNDIKPVSPIKDELKTSDADRKIYLGYDFRFFEDKSQGGGFTNMRFKTYRINNLTFTYPSAPLLTQPDDVAQSLMCNDMNIPEKCIGKEICECIHVEHIPLGSTAEIILFDQGSDQNEQIFHLHGHQFYVVGANLFEVPMNRSQVVKMDSEGTLVNRNLVDPVLRDTVRVPKNGVVVIRFVADNPGFWILRDEICKGWTRGLDVIFQVGGLANVITTPTNFPTCGSYIGPEFFLL